MVLDHEGAKERKVALAVHEANEARIVGNERFVQQAGLSGLEVLLERAVQQAIERHLRQIALRIGLDHIAPGRGDLAVPAEDFGRSSRADGLAHARHFQIGARQI